jgi:nucleotide-binding universal stress UspA family protein
MKNILVLTDFSDVAYNAAEYAIKLAADLKANVFLFNAINARKNAMALSMDEEGDDFDLLAAECLVRLNELSKKLQTTLKEDAAYKPGLSKLLQPGNVKDCINRVVADNKIEIIIMGARQYKDFPVFFFGTKVRDVVEAAQCPVLIINKHTLYKTVKNIFYVTDLRYYDLKILQLLINFAKALNSTVSLLHVCTDGLPTLSNSGVSAIFNDTIAPYINYKNLTCQNANGIDSQSVVGNIIKNNRMEILAIAHKKYHFFNHIFSKDLKRDPAVFTKITIMVIPGN